MSTYTRGEAAEMLAITLGMPTRGAWLAGWSANEIQCGVGCKHPANNLWACGQPMPGSTDWNAAHVKNYTSLLEGVTAVSINLGDANYPQYQRMVHDLQAGLSDSDNIRAGLSTWCGSSCYSGSAGQFEATGKAHAGDLFDDSQADNSVCQTCKDGRQCCNGAVCFELASGSQCLKPGGIPPDKQGCIEDCGGKTCCGTCFAPQILGQTVFSVCLPTWQRVALGAAGIGLMLVGIVLLTSVLLNANKSSPIVQTAETAIAA